VPQEEHHRKTLRQEQAGNGDPERDPARPAALVGQFLFLRTSTRRQALPRYRTQALYPTAFDTWAGLTTPDALYCRATTDPVSGCAVVLTV
jgi:hypothetical protein